MPSRLKLRPRSTPATPEADSEVVFLDEADGILKSIDDTGTVTSLGEGGGVATVYQQAADPGAVGAGVFWLQLDSQSTASYLQLWVRHNDNASWRQVGWADSYNAAIPNFAGNAYDDAGNPLATLGMAESTMELIYNFDPVGANWAQAKVGMTDTGLSLTFINFAGVNLEFILSTTGIRITGLPTADPGVGNKVWNDAGTLKITAAA